MTVERREREDGGIDLMVDGYQVSHVQLSVQFTIGIRDTTGDGLVIAISTPFRFGESDEAMSEPIDPEADDPSLGTVALRLRRKMLTECHIAPDGTLTLVFSDDLLLTVAPDSQYEAWQIDQANFKIIGAAGGELSIWDP